jgi:hypothetical protein
MILVLLFNFFFSAHGYEPDSIETEVVELAPTVAETPPSQLPDAPRLIAPSFKNERFQTSLGTLILNGGFIGEGNNFKLRADFVCKNGRTSQLFASFKFCEFRSVTNPIKGSFELIGQKLRFYYSSTIKPDFSGGTSCSGPTVKEVAIDCTLPAPPKPPR